MTRSFSGNEISLDGIDDITLWEFSLANPIPLFLTSEEDSLLAIFDDKGFFFSHEADQVYQKIKSKPHIYSARSEGRNNIYFGISNQTGGRWRRSHAYHLGSLAYEILGTTRYDDQNHRHWIKSWFNIENFQRIHIDSKYHIRMRERIFISFCVPQPLAIRKELRKAETRLVSLARNKGLNVLNIL